MLELVLLTTRGFLTIHVSKDPLLKFIFTMRPLFLELDQSRFVKIQRP